MILNCLCSLQKFNVNDAINTQCVVTSFQARFLPVCPVFTGFTGLAPETNNKFLTDWSFGHCNADTYVCTKKREYMLPSMQALQMQIK
jgi:hypothetical protein